MSANKKFIFLFSIVALFFVVSILYYVFFLDTWFDEAEFGYKAWLSAEGLAQPLADFRVKQPPVSFYIEAGLQKVFGPSILAGRFLSGAFLVGMGFLIFDILRRVGGKWLGLFGLSLLALHPFIVSKYVALNTYPMIGFFALLGVWFLMSGGGIGDFASSRLRIVLASLAFALAFLGRYNMLPLIVVWWIFAHLRWRDWRLTGLAAAATVGAVSLLMIPYFLINADFALGFFFEMFGPIAKILPFDYLHLPGSFTESSGGSGLLNETRLKTLVDLFTTYFFLRLLVLSGLILWVYEFLQRRKAKTVSSDAGVESRNSTKVPDIFIFAYAATVALIIPHFLVGPSFHKIYSLYFIEFAIIAAAGGAYLIYDYLSRRGLWQEGKAAFTSLLIAGAFLTPISIAISGNDTIFFNRWNFEDSDLARVRAGADFLKSLTAPRDIVLTVDDPHHIFLAGRYEIPALINIRFTYRESDDENLLARFGQYNTAMFTDWVSDTATVIVFQRERLEEQLRSIGMDNQAIGEFRNILSDKFEKAGEIKGVYFRKSERGEGTMEIYRRQS